ncbi:TetR family transcriptional regulator [Rhodococcoides trifolii]|uniref:TetR family transcriptional regulator n=1 Tax=Rhodococcoides trifolii TaxID=908250 RepID=A0A917FST1_9NOCA|nr:TetR/AcrR family transcriptional regulator [Rhodococcus trifolii]GGG02154.1 TetR family transcriptional regulator [Rhodococcus trifolii]
MTEQHQMSRRRAATRERLLDGAMEVFVERGFGRATLEQVCERAGFTRGAFYSNFDSMDEVFVALWRRQSSALVDRVRSALGTVDRTGHSSLSAVLAAALPTLRLDPAWQILTAEFNAHAARNPAVAQMVSSHRRAMRDALVPLVADALALFGRALPPDSDTMGRALLAVYDGAMAQQMVEPDNPDPSALAYELIATVIWSYSSPVK